MLRVLMESLWILGKTGEERDQGGRGGCHHPAHRGQSSDPVAPASQNWSNLGGWVNRLQDIHARDHDATTGRNGC